MAPNELLNSCRDRGLKDDFSHACAVRSQLIASATGARRNVVLADQDRLSVISMISLQRGKPAILEAGQQLPRATGIKRVCTAQESDATWAIQGDEIAFSPDVHASNVKHYSEQWQEVLVRQRRARFTLADIEQRLAEVEAEARKDAIKAQLTASPI